MPIERCPNCQRTQGRLLPESSRGSVANYYRCSICGHVWTQSKDGTNHIRHVTPLDPPAAATLTTEAGLQTRRLTTEAGSSDPAVHDGGRVFRPGVSPASRRS